MQKHINTIEVKIGDIDAFCEPDSGASANIMFEYQFKAPKRTNISELKANYERVKKHTGRTISERGICNDNLEQKPKS